MTSAQKQGVILWRVQRVGNRWTFSLLHPDKKRAIYHETYQTKAEVADALKQFAEQNPGVYHELDPEQFGIEIGWRNRPEVGTVTYYAFTKKLDAYVGYALLPESKKVVEFWRGLKNRYPSQEKIMRWANNGDIHIPPNAEIQEISPESLMLEERRQN